MKNIVNNPIYLAMLLVSSLVSAISFSNYLFIPVSSYIELVFSLSFIAILAGNGIAIRKKKFIKVNFNISDLLLLVFAGYLLVSYILSSEYNFLFDNALLYAAAFCTYIYIRCIFDYSNRAKIRSIFYLLVLIGLFEALYGIMQLSGILPNFFPFKFGGSFGNPGDLANLLVISYSISLCLFFYETKKILKYLLFLSVLIHLSVIAISLARTAWIASFISSVAVLYYFKGLQMNIRGWIRKRKKHTIQFIAILFLVVMLSVAGAYKLYNFKSSSADGRMFVWKLSKELIYEEPFFGHGYNSFVSVQRQAQLDYFKQNPDDSQNGWLAAEVAFAFNDYIQLAVEYGCCALLIILLITGRLYSFKTAIDGDVEKTLLFIGRVALGTILICMLFSYPLQNPTILLCFFILLASVSTFDNRVIADLRLNKIPVQIAATIAVVLLCVMSVWAIQSIKSGLNWKKAITLLDTQPGNCVLQYDSLNKVLRHNRSFVTNYGSVLYGAGEYKRCAQYYEKYGYLCLTSDIYVMLGRSYEQEKEYLKAEENYKNASYLMPHKFVPKYLLFKLFVKTKKYDEARGIALEIRNMKIKVFSKTVKDIKTETNEYLSSQDEINNTLYDSK